ncbi:Cdc6/Cdc18 family protein [Halomarina pelagica]|uniref:Cdc6/Cdc18 family protein n=1 Tax=Halomarina pelagica TaxID=2961599 RepID=UPI0020C422D9|nr:AAA family ATPase [Halomarina sp. BND7]
MDSDVNKGPSAQSESAVQANVTNPANDPLFPPPDEPSSECRIFANKDLLRIGHVPDEDRIVGRDTEIQRIANEIGVVTKNEAPNNIGIYGKTGTGKSLVARHVTQRAQITAIHRGIDVATVYVDCSSATTETKAAKTIARSLNQEHDLGLEIPRRGIGADDYYAYLWEDILSNFDHAIIILDEVDGLREVSAEGEAEGVLNKLSRAEENRFTDCNLGIVTISNKVRFKERLSERVDSSFHQVDFVFKPYDAEQLQLILKNRRDAFHEGVLEAGVIAKCAALSAQEHGDARKAIVVLKAAGEAAEKAGDQAVTEVHLEHVADHAEVDRVRELMRGNTPQAKAVLYALASLHLTSDESAFSTSQIYDRYKNVCGVADLKELTYNGVYLLLREQRFLEIVGSQLTDGKKKNAREHWLQVDPDVALRAVSDDLPSLATADELRERAAS